MKNKTRRFFENVGVPFLMVIFLLAIFLAAHGAVSVISKSEDKSFCLHEIARSECSNRNLTYRGAGFGKFTCFNVTRESANIVTLNFIEQDYEVCQQ